VEGADADEGVEDVALALLVDDVVAADELLGLVPEELDADALVQVQAGLGQARQVPLHAGWPLITTGSAYHQLQRLLRLLRRQRGGLNAR
jgi:hypothetical protein